MEEYKWILITIVFYLAALGWDLSKRNISSSNSPKDLDPRFYLADNKWRLILSFGTSLIMSFGYWLIAPDVADIANQELTSLGAILYAIIGAAPDLLVSYAKRKIDFLKDDKVQGYIRKHD